MNIEELKDTIFNLVEEWNSKRDKDNQVNYPFIVFLCNQLEKRLK